jgi:hypothetical protein
MDASERGGRGIIFKEGEKGIYIKRTKREKDGYIYVTGRSTPPNNSLNLFSNVCCISLADS